MPAYDQATVVNLLKVAAAYGAHPLGEIIGQFADQLKGAQAVIADAEARARKAQSDGDRAIADLETAQATIRNLRDRSGVTGELITALETISHNPKGAKKIAADALAKIAKAKGAES